MKLHRITEIAAAAIVFGATLATPFIALNADDPRQGDDEVIITDPLTLPEAAPLPADDNGDGIIDEDEAGWDCPTMGNLQCGSTPAPLAAAPTPVLAVPTFAG